MGQPSPHSPTILHPLWVVVHWEDKTMSKIFELKAGIFKQLLQIVFAHWRNSSALVNFSHHQQPLWVNQITGSRIVIQNVGLGE